MKSSQKNITKNIMIILVIIFLISFNLLNVKIVSNNDFSIILTFSLIGIISIINIVLDKYKFSLNKTFWYFNLFFLFLAPLLQFLTGYNQWEYYLEENLIFKTNIYILCWLFFYCITRTFVKINKKKSKKIQFTQKEVNHIIIIGFIFVIFMLAIVGFKNLFSRDTYVARLFSNDILNEIVIKTFMLGPVYALVILNIWNKKNNNEKNKKGLNLILFVCVLILNFPASITRYWIGVVYIGVMCVLLKDKLKERTFDIIMILVFAVAFPFAQTFKWYTVTDILQNGVSLQFFGNIYNNVDFDAYSMLARIIEHVDENTIVYGTQLLSCILFFIPRSIWPDKPVPTGQFVAEFQRSEYTNVSAPLIGEAYINFGFMGIIIFSIFLSIIIKKLDYKYWNITENADIMYIEIYYPFLIGFLIFMLRGALQPVIVFMFCFYFYLILVHIYKKIVKKENKY